MSVPASFKAVIVAEKPTKDITSSTFKLVTKDLPAPANDQLVVKTLFLSNDPAQKTWIQKGSDPERAYIKLPNEGDVMPARGLAEVVAAGPEAKKYKVGDRVTGTVGWAEYALVSESDVNPAPAIPGLPPTVALGTLGSVGLTAHYGLLSVGGANADTKTVVVSGAAGATGSLVVQIAKNVVGVARVIGLAGGGEKCKYVESIGADVCIDYKDPSWQEKLREAVGKPGADIYYDNVGGEILDAMFPLIKRYGTIVACGAISSYNDLGAGVTFKNYFEVISNRIHIKGFIVLDAAQDFPQMIGELAGWIKQGKIKVEQGKSETLKQATIDQVPEIFKLLFSGGNSGKLITEIVH
ncbi:quinone oxidoreductase [Savitreella phatthalungensis]